MRFHLCRTDDIQAPDNRHENIHANRYGFLPMSYKFSLVLSLHGADHFDTAMLCRILKDLPGVLGWQENIQGDRFACEYRYGEDSASLHMTRDDDRAITVDGGDASLHLALELQERYPEGIHAVDLECTFAVHLAHVRSVPELKAKMDSGWGFEQILAAR